jgi:hypothetical protein
VGTPPPLPLPLLKLVSPAAPHPGGGSAVSSSRQMGHSSTAAGVRPFGPAVFSLKLLVGSLPASAPFCVVAATVGLAAAAATAAEARKRASATRMARTGRPGYTTRELEAGLRHTPPLPPPSLPPPCQTVGWPWERRHARMHAATYA